MEAGSAARRVQAEERVLDLASRQGTLADLAIELEDALDAGGDDLQTLERYDMSSADRLAARNVERLAFGRVGLTADNTKHRKEQAGDKRLSVKTVWHGYSWVGRVRINVEP